MDRWLETEAKEAYAKEFLATLEAEEDNYRRLCAEAMVADAEDLERDGHFYHY